jgi:RNA polymerase sigma-70 factor (ECF subfamily)
MESLYDLYSRQAYGLAYRIVNDAHSAEDIVQEAFMSVWRSAERVDAARGKLKSYLLTVVHRRAIDFVRARKARPAGEQPENPDAFGSEDPDYAALVASSIEGEAVRSAVRELPEDQLRVVEMAYYSGLTHTEIAHELDVPLGTVKSRLRLALDKLRAVIHPEGAA